MYYLLLKINGKMYTRQFETLQEAVTFAENQRPEYHEITFEVNIRRDEQVA